MLGGEEGATEAYFEYAAGSTRRANDADGPSSAFWAADAAGAIADAIRVVDRREHDAMALVDALLVGAAVTADDVGRGAADQGRGVALYGE